MGSEGLRIAAAHPEFIAESRAAAIDDWLSYFTPDMVLLTAPSSYRVISRLRNAGSDGSRVVAPGDHRTLHGTNTVNGIEVSIASSLDELSLVQGGTASGSAADPSGFIVSDLLTLDIDRNELTTRLHGWDDYTEAFQPADDLDAYCHVSTGLPAKYRGSWDGCDVRGAGIDPGRYGTPLVAIDCQPDGDVQYRTISPDSFGLQSLDNVGPTLAERLASRGCSSREAVSEATLPSLTEIRGIGQTTATRIKASAIAQATGRPTNVDRSSLPTNAPVIIDIETDGLAPSVVWLIGVLDGIEADANYMSFLQKDPNEDGRAVEAFITWYAANARSRPIVAYNGWSFDFPVLAEQIQEHCPGFLPDWEQSYRFDLYHWAVEQGNATLPGRTNTLEDVTDAMGYTDDSPRLTGAAVARLYRDWMDSRSPATEPDWEQLAAYCEDDVRRLALLYRCVQARGQEATASGPNQHATPTGENTTQGSLSDWYDAH